MEKFMFTQEEIALVQRCLHHVSANSLEDEECEAIQKILAYLRSKERTTRSVTDNK